MPSLEQSRRQVKEGLAGQGEDLDHDDILKSLQNEIDEHNAVKEDLRDAMRRNSNDRDDNEGDSAHSMRFRFKSGTSGPRKRRQGSKSGDTAEHRQHHKRRKHRYPPPLSDPEPIHPFPREPTSLEEPNLGSTDAFRESLFDALADDEGAHYWESVYSQPIHVYSRPIIETKKGELEQMDDEEYAAYVKLKMWEKKNPHIVLERERAERKRKDQEEAQTKEREEFVRRKEQAAWERSQRRSGRRSGAGDDDDEYDYKFSGDKNSKAESKSQRKESETAKHTSEEYLAAWLHYLEAWDKLKHELLKDRSAENSSAHSPSQRIPWPVMATSPVGKANIEDFMRNAPADADRTALRILKSERVRWHPDKVQQLFGGNVDEGTMRLVTGVFQVVDALFEGERERSGGRE